MSDSIAPVRVGVRFGRLVVVAPAEPVHYPKLQTRALRWLCRCDCGAERIVHGGNLRYGRTSSCGCRGREVSADRVRTHGRSRTAEHKAWKGLRSRCQDLKDPNYGGRGITVCERWDSFENFLADMGPRPSPKHSVDRIDVNGPYSPENCRWATAKQQARNTRDNHHLTLGDETRTLAEWCERLGLYGSLVRGRLSRGWTVERALLTPILPTARWSRRRGQGNA